MGSRSSDSRKEDKGGLVYSTETGDMRKSGIKGLAGIHLANLERFDASSTAKSERITISLDKKKHRGKTVTMITGLDPGKIEGLLKKLKASCGVGGHTDENNLFLQGDQRERASEILRAEGLSVTVR